MGLSSVVESGLGIELWLMSLVSDEEDVVSLVGGSSNRSTEIKVSKSKEWIS